jgi:acid phosphatase
MLFQRFRSPALVASFFAILVSGASAQIPRSKHVVIVTLENHSYEQVMGNTAMPYFNQLASEYGLATQYYATMHNSLSALMWLTAGQTVTTNDNTTQTFNVDNIVREMQRDGRTWKAYESRLPYAGYLGYNTGLYVKRHDPLAYFTDVESSLRYNIVPSIPNFQNDIANGTLPEYSYVTPDLDEDAHNGTLAQADAWLKANVPQLLKSPQFQQDGILFIVWDEGDVNPLDKRYGGGRVATLVIGSGVKHGYRSTVHYNHQSLLHSACMALALTACPGGGATGVPMGDFFQADGLQVQMMSPTATATGSPLHIDARGVSGTSPATGMAAYVGNQLVAKSTVPSISADVTLAKGTYKVLVRVWDKAGNTADKTQTVTIN